MSATCPEKPWRGKRLTISREASGTSFSAPIVDKLLPLSPDYSVTFVPRLFCYLCGRTVPNSIGPFPRLPRSLLQARWFASPSDPPSEESSQGVVRSRCQAPAVFWPASHFRRGAPEGIQPICDRPGGPFAAKAAHRAGEAGRVSLGTFLPRSKKVPRPPGRVPANLHCFWIPALPPRTAESKACRAAGMTRVGGGDTAMRKVVERSRQCDSVDIHKGYRHRILR